MDVSLGQEQVSELESQLTEVEESNVERVDFPLSHAPTSLQISIHVTNLVAQFGNGATAAFKSLLNDEETLLDDAYDYNFRARQIVDYYGIDNMQAWFSLVYGWSFNKVA